MARARRSSEIAKQETLRRESETKRYSDIKDTDRRSTPAYVHPPNCTHDETAYASTSKIEEYDVDATLTLDEGPHSNGSSHDLKPVQHRRTKRRESLTTPV